MADDSDDPADVIRYWRELERGYDCAFGSRFIPGGNAVSYPLLKYLLNRAANRFIQVVFRLPYNDITNAFKAYRREVIAGCQPLESGHFELTVELPLKAVRCGVLVVGPADLVAQPAHGAREVKDPGDGAAAIWRSAGAYGGRNDERATEQPMRESAHGPCDVPHDLWRPPVAGEGQRGCAAVLGPVGR